MKRLILVVMLGFVHTTMMYADQASTTSSQSPSQGTVDSDAVGVANIHQIDLDTTDIDSGGNWLHKRIWYESSQAVFDDIRLLVSSMSDVRIQFTNEANAIGQKIDTFFGTVTFTKSELDVKFHEMIAELETEKKVSGDLNESEQNLLSSLKEALPAIEKIGQDMKTIGQADIKIEQTLNQAFNTIDECRQLETQAWQAFKSIAKELDDKKARNICYQIKNYKQNIEQKIQYLQSTLLPYLHNVLVVRIEKNIAGINQAVDELKKKSVDLLAIMSKTEENDTIKIKERGKIAAQAEIKKQVDDQIEKDQVEQNRLRKELREAQANSFSVVVHRYYQVTIGRIVQAYYEITSVLGLQTIGNQIISFSSSLSKQIQTYMKSFHDLIMKYLGVGGVQRSQNNNSPHNQPLLNVQTAPEDNHNQTKQEGAKIADAEKVNQNVPDPAQGQALISEQKPQEVKTIIPASLESVSATSQPVEKQTVVVQGLQAAPQEVDQPQTSLLYQVFKNILDLVGTIFLSLYRCVFQFIKMLLSIIVYITSMA